MNSDYISQNYGPQIADDEIVNRTRRMRREGTLEAHKSSWNSTVIEGRKIPEDPRHFKRTTQFTPNPYKRVWNDLQQEEKYVQEQAKNCVLFVPTHAELSRRYMSQAKWLLRKAREENDTGNSTLAQDYFQDALIYRKLAEKHLALYHRILVQSK